MGDTSVNLLKIVDYIASWCNGSTADSGSVCHGSNPCEAATRLNTCSEGVGGLKIAQVGKCFAISLNFQGCLFACGIAQLIFVGRVSISRAKRLLPRRSKGARGDAVAF